MQEKVQGIVLDSFKYKESSLICKVYTKEHGLVSILVNGVRTKRAKVSMAYFQPLSRIEFLLYYKENASLFRGADFSLLLSPAGISLHIIKCTLALFISETVLRTLKEKEEDSRLFALLEYTAHLIEATDEGLQDVHLYFLYQYAEILGLSLKSFRNFVPKESPEYPVDVPLDVLLQQAAGHYQKMGFSREERSKLIKWILHYYMEHLGTFSIKSLGILEDLLSTKHGI